MVLLHSRKLANCWCPHNLGFHGLCEDTSHSPLYEDAVAPQRVYYSSVRAERENVDWRSGQ